MTPDDKYRHDFGAGDHKLGFMEEFNIGLHCCAVFTLSVKILVCIRSLFSTEGDGVGPYFWILLGWVLYLGQGVLHTGSN